MGPAATVLSRTAHPEEGCVRLSITNLRSVFAFGCLLAVRRRAVVSVLPPEVDVAMLKHATCPTILKAPVDAVQ